MGRSFLFTIKKPPSRAFDDSWQGSGLLRGSQRLMYRRRKQQDLIGVKNASAEEEGDANPSTR